MQELETYTDMLQFVTFRLAGQKYAVDILKAQEINILKEITAIPNAPDYVEGAINLRGKVIPVLNLRKKFHLEAQPLNDQTKVIVIDIRGVVMGVIIDAVSDVLRVPANLVEPPPPVASVIRTDFVRGVAKLPDGLVIILDMDKLLDPTEQQALFGGSGTGEERK